MLENVDLHVKESIIFCKTIFFAIIFCKTIFFADITAV